MRLTIKRKPPTNATRTRFPFAIIPRNFDGTWVWLERYTVVERYGSASKFWYEVARAIGYRPELSDE